MKKAEELALERALPAIRRLQQRAAELEAQSTEPIAILSMACRLPGGIDSPESFWDALANERDVIGAFPERWAHLDLYDPDPSAAGKSYAREGGFIRGVEYFDPGFFGISPREAQSMDPQQRLVLEVCWESLERAGIRPECLGETSTGVYLGTMNSDYSPEQRYDLTELDGYRGTGSASSVLSGRVAYVLGLQGPAISVDTACSSSLVALHLACTALRQGECELALAGGVTVMSTPTLFVEFSRLKGLAPDGRCKSFSAQADGAGWAEGCAVLLLKRLSAAQRDGNRILGLLRGSAVNQDGRSHGMTAPNGPSQQRVIRAALAAARLKPADVAAVEAHGTGTPLGDPIEAQALAAVYGEARAEGHPLYLGSCKSNLGHCQAAAGAVGVMKMVLALQNQLLPRTLHAAKKSPHIEWERSGLALLQAAHPWQRGDVPRRAGVSSFGISGTNAHLILEEAPPAAAEVTEPPAPGPLPFVVTGRDEAAVRRQSARWAAWLRDRPGLSLSALSRTTLFSRTHHDTRAVALAADHDELVEALDALAAGREHARVSTGVASRRGKVVFVFPGQGSQWLGMGRALLAQSAAFREAVEACDAALSPLTGWSVLALLSDPTDPRLPPLSRVDVVQPALFAMGIGLAAAWRALGVEPDAVVGHSQGEVTAAVVASALSLEDGARVVVARSRAVLCCTHKGGMALLERPVAEVERLIQAYSGALSIAAVNTASSTVVSGEADAIAALVSDLANTSVFCRRIEVDYASHSPHVSDLLPALQAELAGLMPREARLRFYSSLLGGPVKGHELDGRYWCRNLREPVRFDRALASLLAEGHGVFIETSPHPILALALTGASTDALVLGSLRRGEGDLSLLLKGLGTLFAHGSPARWDAVVNRHGPTAPELPPYPFERQRFWPDGAQKRADVDTAGLAAAEHPWLGARTSLASGGELFTGRLSLAVFPWLAGHQVFEQVLVPGTGLLDLALAAARDVGAAGIAELTLAEPLPCAEPLLIQLTVAGPDDGGHRSFALYSQPLACAAATGRDRMWARHGTGQLALQRPPLAADFAGLLQWPVADTVAVDIEDLYSRLADQGLTYGPAFRGLKEVWQKPGEQVLYVRASLPEELSPSGAHERGYGLHPALLDAVLHALFVQAGSALDAGQVFLPFGWTDVVLHAREATELRVALRVEEVQGERARLAVTAVDGDGQPVLQVAGLELRRANAQRLRSIGRASASSSSLSRLFALALEEVPLAEGRLESTTVIGTGLVSAALGDALRVKDLHELHAALAAGVSVPQRLVVDATAETDAAACLSQTAGFLRLLQAVLADPGFAHTEIVVVTCEAAFVGEAAPGRGLACAPLWGLVRAARNEHLERRFRVVDIDPQIETSTLERLLVTALVNEEPELVVRKERATAVRLVRALPGEREEPVLDPQGTVLITGGTGELGQALAQHLVSAHGARHLVLTSRRGAVAPGTAVLLSNLEAAGAERVQVLACDVADRADVERVLGSVDPAHPLTSVFHLAGVLDDGLLANQDDARLQAVLAPKVLGALNLDALTRHIPLKSFVLFSSLAGILGGAGQGPYAAANAFLDALAVHRRARGLPALSLAWGLWEQSGLGMTSHLSTLDLARLRRQGIAALAVRDGLALLDTALRSHVPCLVPVDLDIARLQTQADQGEPLPALLCGLVRKRTAPRAVEGGAGSALAAGLVTLPEQQREQAVVELVRREASQVLSLPRTKAVAKDQVLKNLGLDSLMAVELRNRLSKLAGIPLPATLAFDCPTPVDVARLLLQRLLGEKPGGRAGVQRSRTAPGDEPIAIVAMACRLPGGLDTPEALWEALACGADLIEELPARWRDLDLYDRDPDAPGKSYSRHGGFIRDIDCFDAAFFGIAPREAEAMDPQQRVILEVAWEALERAGIRPLTLSETRTGIYLGTMGSDYALSLRSDLLALDGYQSIGNASSVLSGRVAYVLGTQGPALTVDTACSSSLVALHLAAAGLRNGECDMALAGGITLMSSPTIFVEFSRLKGMAADGRCKSFSAQADGAGWSEGCGVLILKRLSDAERSGDRILAVLRGSAVNQDGRSQGLTAPNGPAQERVINEALAAARLTACDIDAIEAHGTGTSLGDPIEANALARVFGPGRPVERPLHLGSSKSNLGHAQAAAGVVGVMKMVLALQHEFLPRTLHCEEANPAVMWSESGLSLLVEGQRWPRSSRVRRAGVSSFGICGTNAHVILEEASPRPDALGHVAQDAPGPLPLLISARSESSLRVLAGRWAAWLDNHREVRWADVVATAARHRTHFAVRSGVVADSPAEAAAQLRALAAGQAPRDIAHAAPGEGALAVIFTGQGSQRPGMGKELAETHPEFRDRLAEVLAALDVHLERPLATILWGPSDGAHSQLLGQTAYTQPALFALEVALFRQWAAWGLKPEYVAGHSVGELAAAHVAGILSLEDAAKLVCARGRLMQDCERGGAMVSLDASEAEVQETLATVAGRIAIAGLNGPRQTVVSGDEAPVLALAEAFRARGCRVRRLDVSHAFHSPHMDAMLQPFARVAKECTYRTPCISFVSTLTGTARADVLTPAYWVRQARDAVRFADAMATLERAGVRRFLECGPAGVLSSLGAACLPQATFVPSLRGDGSEARALADAAVALYAAGESLEPAARSAPGSLLDLPTYAFQRERYWCAAARRLDARRVDVGHAWFDAVTELADGGSTVLSGQISLEALPWLADHVVHGTVIVPGAVLLDLALASGAAVGATSLAELTLVSPVSPEEPQALQIQVMGPDAQGRRSFSLFCRPLEREAAWTQHGAGSFAAPPPVPSHPFAEAAHAPPASSRKLEVGALREGLARRGLAYGPAFSGLQELYVDAEQQVAWARVVWPEALRDEDTRYGVHPALLDAAFHTLMALVDAEQGDVMLPISFSEVVLHSIAPRELRVRVALQASEEPRAQLLVFDRHGRPVLTIGTIRLRRAGAEQLRSLRRRSSAPLYRVAFHQPAALPLSAAGRDAVVIAPPGSRLAGALGGERTDAAGLWAALTAGRDAPTHVVLDATTSLALDGAAAGESLVEGARTIIEVQAAVAFLKRWLQEPRLVVSELVLITRRAIAARRGEAVLDVVRAAHWGLVRSLRSEHAERRIRLVDVDRADVDPALLDRALQLGLDPVSGECEVAVRGAELLVPRLVRCEGSGPPAAPIGPAGTVLLTGGTGALGRALCQHLVARHGVRHLILLSRSGSAGEETGAFVSALQRAGAQSVRVIAQDVTKREEVAAALAAADSNHPLSVVVHLAGALDDGLFAQQSDARIQRVLAPKVLGAMHLDSLLPDHVPLILFSSVAGTLGSSGQSSYAAANAFLDALAARRRARGGRGQSLAWGLWEPRGGGMTAHLGVKDLARFARQGFAVLSAAVGFDCFDQALAVEDAHVLPVELRLADVKEDGAVHPLLRSLRSEAPRRSSRAQDAAESAGLKEQVAALPPEARGPFLLERVRKEVAAVLGLATAHAVHERQTLSELGLDSLMAVELRNRLCKVAETALPASLAFDYPTPGAIAGLLLERLGSASESAPPKVRLQAAQIASVVDRLRHVRAEELEDHGLGPSLLGLLAALERLAPAAPAKAAPDGSTAEDLFDFLDRKLGAVA